MAVYDIAPFLWSRRTACDVIAAAVEQLRMIEAIRSSDELMTLLCMYHVMRAARIDHHLVANVDHLRISSADVLAQFWLLGTRMS